MMAKAPANCPGFNIFFIPIIDIMADKKIEHRSYLFILAPNLKIEEPELIFATEDPGLKLSSSWPELS